MVTEIRTEELLIENKGGTTILNERVSSNYRVVNTLDDKKRTWV